MLNVLIFWEGDESGRASIWLDAESALDVYLGNPQLWGGVEPARSGNLARD